MNRLNNAPRLPGGQLLSANQRECAKNAADMLGLIYGADFDTTYRSWSPTAHIEGNNYVPRINELRQYFGKSPLHTSN